MSNTTWSIASARAGSANAIPIAATSTPIFATAAGLSQQTREDVHRRHGSHLALAGEALATVPA
jgi:hypothetical protein